MKVFPSSVIISHRSIKNITINNSCSVTGFSIAFLRPTTWASAHALVRELFGESDGQTTGGSTSFDNGRRQQPTRKRSQPRARHHSRSQSPTEPQLHEPD